MVPPIRLAFAAGNLGRSGSRLAGSITTSTGAAVDRTISIEGVLGEDSDGAMGEDSDGVAVEGSDGVLTEGSEAGAAAEDPDTTL